ncbi:MAG: hypothetical protein KAS04_06185 [Candidatus Aenigmarchaeota archaeon]|nr:hypothetical protein [Candidatus Aenigmarchaeota archaeon]
MKRWLLLVPALMLVVIISGCTTEPVDSQGQGALSQVAPLSEYVDIEVTVVSLSLEDPEGYYEGDELYRAPRDSAVIRIDKIVETGGSYDFDWTSVGIKEGSEVPLDFKYTVRPAKIITVVGETTQSNDNVSHQQIVPTEITFEDVYFVFRINGNSETETTLPGLKEGSRFKTRLWRTFETVVEKYEILKDSK